MADSGTPNPVEGPPRENERDGFRPFHLKDIAHRGACFKPRLVCITADRKRQPTDEERVN